ncbi:unnamed protein product [Penicillium olsonii]|nr:unnamed protein product [Penicillium olsonii]CAG7929539.1 unnamed protein product [Penicillium olsonii]
MAGVKRKRSAQTAQNEDENNEEPSETCTTTDLLLDRFSKIERQLREISSSRPTGSPTGRFSSKTHFGGSERSDGVDHVEDDNVGGSHRTRDDTCRTELGFNPDSGEEERAAYRGETAIAHTLQRVEESLGELGTCAQDTNPSLLSPPSPLRTSESPITDRYLMGKKISRALDKYQICPRNGDWDTLLDLFSKDVHPLYPFLHLPCLQTSYDILVRRSHPTDRDMEYSRVDSFAQVLICLALGRCTTSVRVETSDGLQTSGWSLYCAAVESLGDIFDPFEENQSLSRLQVLLLMVIYLIRIDANDRAQKVLSLAVVQAHHLGLHRESVLRNTSAFLSECSKRLWWCIYIIDKRLALDLGQPFLIQDQNIDTQLPNRYSEATLERMRENSASVDAAQSQFSEDPEDDPSSPISYLQAMVEYSKIVRMVWNVLYPAYAMDRPSDPTVTDYFEDLLGIWKHKLPLTLCCDETKPSQTISTNACSWSCKNKFLITIRALWLQILIRKPMRSRHSSVQWVENFENESKCIMFAKRIVDFFGRVFEPFRVYTFPFLQYLLGAASTILGLVIKVPAFWPKYKDSLIQAERMMTTFCRKTWVSGKSLRSITKYTELVSKVMKDTEARGTFHGGILSPASTLKGWTFKKSGHQVLEGKIPAIPGYGYRGKNMPGEADSQEQLNRHGSDTSNEGISPFSKSQSRFTAPFMDMATGGSGQGFRSSTANPDFPPHMSDLVMTDFPFETCPLDSTQLQLPLSGNCEGYLEDLLDLDKFSGSL